MSALLLQLTLLTGDIHLLALTLFGNVRAKGSVDQLYLPVKEKKCKAFR